MQSHTATWTTPAIDRETLNLTATALVSPGSLPQLSPAAHFAVPPRVTAGHEPLIAVAASYAALTLRAPSTQRATRAYPLILLAGWLWDDMVDHHKDDPSLTSQISTALRAFSRLLEVTPPPSASVGGRLTPTNLDALRLLSQAVQLVDAELPPYSRRLRDSLWVFLKSFSEKAGLRRTTGHSLDEYVAVRARCVGMSPCFELAYAIKANARGIAPQVMMDFADHEAVVHGAKLATLHCAAVNDLFSLYKDRQLEDTVNFPLLLAPDDSVDGYWQGARATLAYVRQLVNEVQHSVTGLRGPTELVRVISETWLEMMEGNVLFHLTVPRYKEGVDILRHLTNPALTPAQSRRAFRTSFPPEPGPDDRSAVA